MSTRDWMKGAYEPAKDTETKTDAKQRRSPLEVALATAGFAAWLWCAYELVIGVIR